MFKKIVLTTLMLGLLTSACGAPEVEEPQDVGIANPASAYCIEQGGTLVIREDADGGQYGVCLFEDGSECEEWAYFRGECAPGQNTTAPAPGAEEAVPEAVLRMQIYAWYGRVEAAPPEMSSAATKLVLWPEGTGDLLMTGETGEIETELMALRDAEGIEKDAHIWGTLTCSQPDTQTCRIIVSKVRPTGNTQPGGPEPVDNWVGLIYSGPEGPGSGGDDYFVLVGGPFNVQFGLDSTDETVRSQIAAARDSVKAVMLSGQMLAGVPDWGGTQIQVWSIGYVDLTPESIKGWFPWPSAPSYPEVDTSWETFTNERYGYQFDYPPEAEINWTGVMGYPTEAQPEGMSSEEFYAQLQEQYGDNLCVTIRYALGTINILPNWEDNVLYNPCGRTGVGAGEMLDLNQIMVIDGQTYTATGFEFMSGQGETLDHHNQTMRVILADGTKIEYGSTPRSDATYEDYLNRGHAMILQIISTYRVMP